MNIHLTEEVLFDIKENSQFISDGCACGDYVYKLASGVWLSVYQSCRKSSMTPDEKLWQLQNVTFYDDLVFSTNEYKGTTYIDDIEEFGQCLEHYILDEESKQKLYHVLKKKTKELWGDEYRDGGLDEEEQVENFVDELNTLLQKYNYELLHADELHLREVNSENTYEIKASLHYNEKLKEMEVKSR